MCRVDCFNIKKKITRNHADNLSNDPLSFYSLTYIITNCVFRSNLVEGIDVAYIHKCLHDPDDAPLCPIFRLGDIVKQSGFNFETIARVVSQLHYIFTQHWMDRNVFPVERQISIPSKHSCTWTLFWCFVPFVLPCYYLVSCVYCVSWQGGAIGIVVDWTCNLDFHVKHCKPKYNFHGLYGNPSERDKTGASVGYNFRCVSTLHWINTDSGVFTQPLWLRR